MKHLIVEFAKQIACFSRVIASWCHNFQQKVEWFIPPQPEWFDHYCDQFYQFKKFQNPLWMERGIFGLLAIKPNANVLEICCGDGFNAYHFYSSRAQKVVAVDRCKKAINHARRFNSKPQIKFVVADITQSLPDGAYDVVVFDAAIYYFADDQLATLLKNLKNSMRVNGVLTGYTIAKREGDSLNSNISEQRIPTKQALANLLTPYFKNVKVFQTQYESRVNLYFYASDGVLPFDVESNDCLSIYQVCAS